MVKKPEPNPTLIAARKIVEARMGDKYEIYGCDLPEESEHWTFWVELKDTPPLRRRMQAVTITQDQLDDVINNDLEISQIQGLKPKPEEVAEAIREEYNSGLDNLLEERD